MSLNTLPFVVFDSVDSTNNYAMGMVQKGSWKHGDACFSFVQTAGKGRRGKHWLSNEKENIILSIVVDTGFLRITDQFYLSAIAALSCYDLFIHYALDKTSVKWPNDIYWCDRKAAGTLIENVIRGDKWQYSVVGIGMNINQTKFPEGLNRPVSLKQVTGKTFDVLILASQLYHLFFKRFEMLIMKQFDLILAEYNLALYKRGELTRLKLNSAVFETKITGVSPDGKLHTSDVLERSFDFDEIQWV